MSDTGQTPDTGSPLRSGGAIPEQPSPPTAPTAPTADRTAELEELRRQVAELESELGVPPAPPAAPAAAPHRPGRVRATFAAICIVLACVLAPLSVVAVWAHDTVSNTDQYVATMAPVIEDPSVQRDLSTAVSNEILARIDVSALTSQAVTALSQQGLPPRAAAALRALQVPVVNGVEGFTRDQVAKVVASPQFATVWNEANRAAHAQLVRLLSGEGGGAVTAQNGELTLNLAPIIAEVKSRLVARGFTVAQNIPTVNKSFVLVQSDGITKAQGAYRLLNALGRWLPVLAVILLGLGVYLARDRRRALLRGSLGVAGSMLVLGVAIAVARPLYLDALPGTVLSQQSAGTVFDTLVRFLRDSLRVVALVAVVVALGAFFTGPSRAATRSRSVLARGIGSARGGAESAGLRTGPVGAWIFAHRLALRWTVVVAGAVVLVLWSKPTIAVVLWTVVCVLIALGLVELLARPPAQSPVEPPVEPPVQPQAGAQQPLQPGTPEPVRAEAAVGVPRQRTTQDTAEDTAEDTAATTGSTTEDTADLPRP